MTQEASALGFLIENKFGKNNGKSSDDSSFNQKQQGDN